MPNMETSEQRIILPGFDVDKQLQYTFKNATFASQWLKRVYTNEDHPFLKRSERGRLKEIRFGNNIAVLFKACYHFRSFYGCKSFWPNIARNAFGTMPPELAFQTASCFVEARRIFLLKERSSSRFESLTTRAVDGWIDFLDGRPVQQPFSAPATEPSSSPAEFFECLKGTLIDSARVISESEKTAFHAHTPARFAPPPGPRKRSPSPNPPCQPPSAKRRPLSGTPDRPDAVTDAQARAPPSLPPLATGISIFGHAKGDPYQTPSTAQDGRTPDGYFSQDTPDGPAELKIRGIAGNFQSPSHGTPDETMEESISSYQELRDANLRLHIRVSSLEKERERSGQALVQAMDARFASLVERMEASIAQPAQDDSIITEMEKRIVSLETRLRAAQKQLPDENEAYRKLKDKVAALEKQLGSRTPAQRLGDTGDKAGQSVETRVGALEVREDTADKYNFTEAREKAISTDREPIAEAESIQNLEIRTSALIQKQERISKASDKAAGQNIILKSLERQISFLQTKLDSFGANQGIDELLRELDERIASLQGSITTVQDKISDLPHSSSTLSLLKKLLKEIESLPTSQSVSEKVAQSAAEVNRSLNNVVEKTRKETLRDIAQGSKDAQDVQAVAFFGQSARIDELAKDLEGVKTALQSMPQDGTLTALEGKVDILAKNFDNSIQTKPQDNSLDITMLTSQTDYVLQRVQKVERALQGLKDALLGKAH